MDDPTQPAKEQLQVNGSTLVPRSAPPPCSPSPTSFHWEQYFFSRVPSQGLYLTRSKSFPYYLLAIALSLFQTSSSGFVLLDRAFGSLYPLFLPLVVAFSSSLYLLDTIQTLSITVLLLYLVLILELHYIFLLCLYFQYSYYFKGYILYKA